MISLIFKHILSLVLNTKKGEGRMRIEGREKEEKR